MCGSRVAAARWCIIPQHVGQTTEARQAILNADKLLAARQFWKSAAVNYCAATLSEKPRKPGLTLVRLLLSAQLG
jgi:hypothetical protein